MACYWITEMGPKGGTKTCRYRTFTLQQPHTCNICCCMIFLKKQYHHVYTPVACSTNIKKVSKYSLKWHNTTFFHQFFINEFLLKVGMKCDRVERWTELRSSSNHCRQSGFVVSHVPFMVTKRAVELTKSVIITDI